MSPHPRAVFKVLVGQDDLGPPFAQDLELHGHQRLADTVRGIVPVPREHEPDGALHFVVDANGEVRVAGGIGHRESVVTANP